MSQLMDALLSAPDGGGSKTDKQEAYSGDDCSHSNYINEFGARA